ncbi:MAG: quinoprotein dehydrogenase-associated putative ABC transporter substrate-binding protein [Gammaproteobacteria bacterium]|nr:quinoprotein dehydrogenase-associated putative ABC transporter substrate-binding protein [Gammaproteobacteria bacterium]
MKNVLRMIVATSTLLLTASAYATPTEALRICADPGNMPLSNTQREGFQNKIADVIAKAMGRHTTYFYRPYLERGLTRQTFKNNSCDVLMGMSTDAERMITSTPLYRSTFLLASRADRNYNFKSLDDPRLKELTVGVFQHSATRTELMEHGVSGSNVKLHIISHDADLHPEFQPIQQVQDVVDGKLDVAAVWGPYAGWFNSKQLNAGKPLALLPLNQVETILPMEFEMTIGLKKRDTALLAEVEQALLKSKNEIKQILMDFGVPLVECDVCIVSGDMPSHGPYKKQEFISAKFQPTEQSNVAELPSIIDAALAGGSSLDEELLYAVLLKDFTKVEYLIKRGADINATDSQGLTPLMTAVKGGNYDLVKLLLEYKADIDAVDADGWTATMHAAYQNEPKMIRLIAGGYGANLDLVEKLSSSTALGLAAQKGKPLAIVALLDSGANPDTKMGEAGYTPLMIVSKIGSLPAAQVLTQYKADVNAQNAGGVTALMIAAANNHVDVVSLLVKSGADTTIKNKRGQTALDDAKESKAQEAIDFLTRFIANQGK